MDPLTKGERHRADLALEVDRALQQVSTAIGEMLLRAIAGGRA
jgi:hypothetical protein